MRDGENRVRWTFNAKRKMTDNFSPRNEARKGENQLPVLVPVGLENSKISLLSRSFFLIWVGLSKAAILAPVGCKAGLMATRLLWFSVSRSQKATKHFIACWVKTLEVEVMCRIWSFTVWQRPNNQPGEPINMDARVKVHSCVHSPNNCPLTGWYSWISGTTHK